MPSMNAFLRSTLPMAFCLMLMSFTYGCTRVQHIQQGSSSMSPTIQPGQIVSIDRTAYQKAPIRRWDIVAFVPSNFPDDLWIFRVVGLPGENISVTNGKIYSSKEELAIPKSLNYLSYVEGANQSGKAIRYPIPVPPNSYFLLGDNSSLANDSRYSWTYCGSTNRWSGEAVGNQYAGGRK